MIRRLFPEDSNQFNFLKSIFKSFDKEFIDRLELFFPMWCMFAFQHYLVKSFDIIIFKRMAIDLNANYIFSLIKEDWIGIVNIIFHTILFLWLMRKYDTFGPFRTVKSDFQTNFLLFLAIYALIDIFIFGKMMLGYFLMSTVLYLIYRSDSYISLALSLLLTIITMLLSISFNEPILATGSAIYLPFLVFSLIFKSKKLIVYAQRYLPLIIFIFIATKELWFGFIGLSYFLFFNMFYYFSLKLFFQFDRCQFYLKGVLRQRIELLLRAELLLYQNLKP